MRWSPHPLSLRQLQYLVAVAETRSFHRAADLCHVSQPSLSSQVAQAERALGAQIFERDRRHVLVTQAGEELLRRARQLLVEADDLVDVLARYADPLAGTLRIGVIPTISPYLIPDAAPALRRAFPTLHVQWLEDKTTNLVASLHRGETDAALLALEADLGDVEHEVIGYDPFVLAAAQGHPLGRTARPVKAAELNDVELLVLAEGHCLRDQAISACKRAHSSSFGATSLPTLVQMVAGGTGVTLLPALALSTENRRGELRIRTFTRPGPGRTLALAWRRGAAAAAALPKIASVMRRSLEKVSGGR